MDPLQRLYGLNGSKALCPRLRQLRWIQQHTGHSSLIAFLTQTLQHFLFVPPSLRRKDVMNSSSGLEDVEILMCRVLDTIATQTPSLQNLFMGIFTFRPRVYESLARLHHLENLDIFVPNLSDKLMTALGFLTHLSRLQLICSSVVGEWKTTDIIRMQAQLPSLHTLMLRVSASMVEPLLNAISAPLLQALDITLYLPVSSRALQVICTTVASENPSLRKFSLLPNIENRPVPFTSWHNTGTRIIDVFGSLRSLRQLQKVTLVLSGEHPSLPEDIAQLLQAWPEAEVVKIKPCSALAIPANTLVDIVERCRKLKLLELPPVDFRPVVKKETGLRLKSAQRTSYHLRYLHIIPSVETGQPIQAARFLQSCFPLVILEELQAWNTIRRNEADRVAKSLLERRPETNVQAWTTGHQNEAFVTIEPIALTREMWWQEVLDEWRLLRKYGLPYYAV